MSTSMFEFWRNAAEEKLQTTGIQIIKRQSVDIEFVDLAFSVPISRTGHKLILKNVNGYFKSGELSAILGHSGAGKTTLLSLLAGYTVNDTPNSILINGKPRDIKSFRKLSRYIMQEDVHQPGLTVLESLQISANLKLGKSIAQVQKMIQIEEILDLLRLSHTKNTFTSRLSGGEKKRLSVALELINNPPVLFLDEPTTGLDDMSSAQCAHLLKTLARQGRNVICSIHTPSSRIFALFDNVYIMSSGQCIFHGKGENIVPFLAQFGLHCPLTYNPADFILDVANGDYGDFQDHMVRGIKNGKIHRFNNPETTILQFKERPFDSEVKSMPDFGCCAWEQFIILLTRMNIQLFRDWNMLFLRPFIHMCVALVIGLLYYKFGNDGSKMLFNFGFAFISINAFLFLPMLPAVVWFPQEVRSIKREYFNQWYSLNAYFFAVTIFRLPLQILQCLLYIFIVYYLTGQPLETVRFMKFTLILVLVCLTSEALGMAVSSRLSIFNGVFFGPAICVTLTLFAVYGIGAPIIDIPIWARVLMYCSYIRFGLEGTMLALYGEGREVLDCPEEEMFCPFRIPKFLIKELGMEDGIYWIDVAALVGYFFLFRIICYVILRQRLLRFRTSGILWVVEKLIKTYINFNVNH